MNHDEEIYAYKKLLYKAMQFIETTEEYANGLDKDKPDKELLAWWHKNKNELKCSNCHNVRQEHESVCAACEASGWLRSEHEGLT